MKRFSTEIKSFLLLASIFIVVLLFDIIAVSLFYNHVNGFLNDQSVTMKADAGVIFFGDYIKDGNELGPDSKQRALQAVSLYKADQINKIVCVGGYNYKYWSGEPHLMSEYIARHGVPMTDILFDTLSFNTISNWIEAQKIIKKNNFKSVIAISEPLHTYRIACMIDAENVYYSTYQYRLEKLVDYWYLYKRVHREFISHFLNFALRDHVRNKLVYTYRAIRIELKKIF